MLDIDGCFTNNIDLPKLPNEQEQIRILNVRIRNYFTCALDFQELKDQQLR